MLKPLARPSNLARLLALPLVPLVLGALASAAPQAQVGHQLYSTIQQAIDAAPAGLPTRVEVHRGTYEENLDLLGKPIVLVAVDGPLLTTLRGDGTGPVVRIESGEPAPTALIGFTIVGGHGSLFGGGVRIDARADVAILGCRFGAWNDDDPAQPFVESNVAMLGGGISCRASRLLLANCTFWQNEAIMSGAAVYLGAGTRASIVQCTISGNLGPGATALSLSGSSEALVENSILWDNLNSDIAVGGYASLELRHCTISLGEWTGAGSDLSSLPPQFAAPLVGDLRLLPGSPCIDAGDSFALPVDAYDLDGDGDLLELLPVDLLGSARLVDAPWAPDAGLGVVDQGALEVPGVLGRGPTGVVDLP